MGRPREEMRRRCRIIFGSIICLLICPRGSRIQLRMRGHDRVSACHSVRSCSALPPLRSSSNLINRPRPKTMAGFKTHRRTSMSPRARWLHACGSPGSIRPRSERTRSSEINMYRIVGVTRSVRCSSAATTTVDLSRSLPDRHPHVPEGAPVKAVANRE